MNLTDRMDDDTVVLRVVGSPAAVAKFWQAVEEGRGTLTPPPKKPKPERHLASVRPLSAGGQQR